MARPILEPGGQLDCRFRRVDVFGVTTRSGGGVSEEARLERDDGVFEVFAFGQETGEVLVGMAAGDGVFGFGFGGALRGEVIQVIFSAWAAPLKIRPLTTARQSAAPATAEF